MPALLATAAQAALAQAEPQQIVVTATRAPARVSDLVAEVTVLDRAALDRAEGRTLVELLAQQAGIQFTSNGGLGKSSSLFIRGLEARHTLLLVDGVRIGSATLGTPSLDNLPLEIVDRIEIVRGPMSSLYGNGAMGGVIQVITKRGAPGLAGNAKVSGGSNGYGQAAGGVSFGVGGFDLAAQLQATRTDGVSATNEKVPFGSYNPDDDGFRQTAGSLRLGLQFASDWRAELLALHSQGRTQIDDGPGADAKADLENDVGALSLRGSVMPGWTTRLSLSEATDGYDTLASASAFASLGKIETRTRQFSWENSVDTPIGALLALAERTKEKVSRPDEPFTVSERDIDGVALGLDGSRGAHAWQGSLRRDRNSQFGGVTTGALGYGYAVTPAWRLGASYGTSHTLPSFNQLYYPGFGNPDLQPEKGRHGELSLRWTGGEHSLRAAYFEHRYRNFISSGPQPVNLPRVKTDGVTLAYEGRWRDLDLDASFDEVDPRNETNGSANQGKLLQRHARRQLRLGGDWKAGAWSAGATLVGSSFRYDDAANTTRLGGYGTLDLRADWSLAPQWRLGARLNNVADKAYETALGYNQPGREAFVTLRYTTR